MNYRSNTTKVRVIKTIGLLAASWCFIWYFLLYGLSRTSSIGNIPSKPFPTRTKPVHVVRYNERETRTTSIITPVPLYVFLGEVEKTTLRKELGLIADKQRRVVFSVTDFLYAEFALNLARNIQQLAIKNFILVCLDVQSEAYLQKNKVDCIRIDLVPEQDLHGPSNFGEKGYYLKTNLKTVLVGAILELDYHPLVVDVDVALFKDPFVHFTCHSCDMQTQMDRSMLNTGFTFVRATNTSRRLYGRAWNLYRQYRKSHDQTYLNMAVRELKNGANNLHVLELPASKFLAGVYYFEQDGREFGGNLDKRCDDCVMAHNNYLSGIAAKKYRFQENLLWNVDSEGYYSNAIMKYLLFDNPGYFGDKTYQREISALHNALVIAHFTNRTLILPDFSCCDCKRRRCDAPRHRCSLLHLVRMRTFDEMFKGKYREHSFLRNKMAAPEVLSAVKSATRLKILFEKEPSSNVSNPYSFIWRQSTHLNDFVSWIQSFASKQVVYYPNLYNGLPDSATSLLPNNVKEKLQTGLQCSTYEQFEVDVN